MKWTFSFQKFTDASSGQATKHRTFIYEPIVNGKRTRQMFEYGVHEANTDPKLASVHHAKLLRHGVVDLSANKTIRNTTYQWTFQAGVVDFNKLRNWGSREVLAWQHLHNARGRRLAKKTITLDGQRFKTEYANFDQYGNPRLKGEYHNHTGRTIEYTYHNQGAPRWVIGKIKTKKVHDVTGTQDHLALERTYNTHGAVRTEKTNGLLTTYTYHPDGNLHKVVDGRNIVQEEFLNYKLGLPQRIKRPDGREKRFTVNSKARSLTKPIGKAQAYPPAICTTR